MMNQLPREILIWLQTLDLSYAITNPKRDFSNGFLVAEMVSRYHPERIRIASFDNSLALAAKENNWEQLLKVFKKLEIPIQKGDYDPVIHYAVGAAIALIYKLYYIFTKKIVNVPPPLETTVDALPDFSRPTASWILKDHELDRISDNIIRSYHCVNVLDRHNENIALYRYNNAGRLIASQRAAFEKSEEEIKMQAGAITGKVTEVQLKSLQINDQPSFQKDDSTPTKPLRKLSTVKFGHSAVGNLDGLPNAGAVVKPCADLMKPLIVSLINEQLDPIKDPLIEFVEFALRDQDEKLSVKVLELLGQRASLLIDTCIKSPVENWKLWTSMLPLLSETLDTSPIFEATVTFFRNLGIGMKETESELTQQLFLGIGLPMITNLFINAPGKREALCEMCVMHLEISAHVVFLRELKRLLTEAGTNLYIQLLSYVVLHEPLYDETILDLYLYYCVIGLQSVEAKVRIAALSILAVIASDSSVSARQSVINLVSHFAGLAQDRWWEVQAQLSHVIANVLAGLPESAKTGAVNDENKNQSSINSEKVDGTSQEISKGGKSPEQIFLQIIPEILHPHANKNTCQVALCAFARTIVDYPHLIQDYTKVLITQPSDMRKRLLKSRDVSTRIAYVFGVNSRLYEEIYIPELWPAPEVAFAVVNDNFTDQEIGDARYEIVAACFAAEITDPGLWTEVIESMKKILPHALINPMVQKEAFAILQNMWSSPVMVNPSLEILEKTIVETLGNSKEPSTAGLWENLRSSKPSVAEGVKRIVESLKISYPAEFEEQNFIL